MLEDLRKGRQSADKVDDEHPRHGVAAELIHRDDAWGRTGGRRRRRDTTGIGTHDASLARWTGRHGLACLPQIAAPPADGPIKLTDGLSSGQALNHRLIHGGRERELEQPRSSLATRALDTCRCPSQVTLNRVCTPLSVATEKQVKKNDKILDTRLHGDQ
jgi:hypothetical protein